MNLKEKIVIVTGAGRGLGKVIALTLAKEKVNLALLARTKTELESVASAARALGANALAIPTDLRKPEEITAAIKQVLETYGTIDVLINNAGFSPQLRPVIETRLEDWEHVIELNARAPFLLSQACLPVMQGKKSGHIINIVTAAVELSIGTISAYRASKAALLAFAQCLREEVKTQGVRVTNILPEPMDTPMRWEVMPEYPKDQVIAPEEVARTIFFVLQHDGGSFVGEVPIRKVLAA
jgi:NAD(P)-dependent dehydrogenase (short-subunit alcohol dehydrogenase family)